MRQRVLSCSIQLRESHWLIAKRINGGKPELLQVRRCCVEQRNRQQEEVAG